MSEFRQKVTDYLKPAYSRTRWITYCGVLIALYIFLSYFNIKISSIIEIRVGYFALAVAGMMGGPLMGLTVGALGDILQMLLTGGQGFTIAFTLCYAFMGICYGFIFYKKKITVIRAIAGAFVEFFTSMFLITSVLSMLYGMPWKATFISRIPKCIAMLFIYSVLMFVVIKSLNIALQSARLLDREA